jgi:UDP-2,4-diacetamido-2,4,6-trideoxy-beta-L-altropyranose hydrolase
MSQNLLLIRADAGSEIGTGHVMRCLALAQAWQDAGGQAVFATTAEVSGVEQRLSSEGFAVERIAAQPSTRDDAALTGRLARDLSATFTVLDGYRFGAEYQRSLKDSGQKILFIDDYGHAEHYFADYVLDQNSNANEEFYRNREPNAQLLLGTEYVLLRREFRAWREWKRDFPETARKLLVTLGGADPGNITLRIIQALKRVRVEGLETTVLVGAANPYWATLGSAARGDTSIRLVHNVANVPNEMARADVAIIAAGGTLWELLFMGNSVVSYSRNQIHSRILSDLAGRGAVHWLGDVDDLDEERLAQHITHVAGHRVCRERMSKSARGVVDGMGVNRVCQALGIQASGSSDAVRMVAVSASEKDEFLCMARQHFSELNPEFTPHPDWTQDYFASIQSNSAHYLRWIMRASERAGFILFGIEKHRFLPRQTGMIYELYVAPAHRRKGVARRCARQAIAELRSFNPSKIQLETVEGNAKANALWRSMGFSRVAERYVLQELEP